MDVTFYSKVTEVTKVTPCPPHFSTHMPQNNKMMLSQQLRITLWKDCPSLDRGLGFEKKMKRY